jgi:hypothetical protein
LAQQLGGWLNGLLTPVYGREAALGAPAIPILVGIGFATGQLGAAAIAAGAAFSVGFGAARDLAGWRWAAMFTAAAGLPLATFIGCTTAEWFPGFVMVVGLSAAACGWLALVEEDLWWVVLQLVIALLVAGHYPSPAKRRRADRHRDGAGSAVSRRRPTPAGGAAARAAVAHSTDRSCGAFDRRRRHRSGSGQELRLGQ